MKNLTKVWKRKMGPLHGGRAWSRGPNLHCLKSYKIRNTITDFQKLNFKNEVSKLIDSEKVKPL